jgi:hypothetical protein
VRAGARMITGRSHAVLAGRERLQQGPDSRHDFDAAQRVRREEAVLLSFAEPQFSCQPVDLGAEYVQAAEGALGHGDIEAVQELHGAEGFAGLFLNFTPETRLGRLAGLQRASDEVPEVWVKCL